MPHLRVGVFLLISSLAFLSLVVAATSNSTAVAQEPSITVTPSSGDCGELVMVSGTGFPADSEMVVIVTRGGDHGIDPVPATETDDAGSFTVSVQVETDGCPSPLGMQAFACALPLCDPKVSVPFEITVEPGLPTTGTGRVDSSQSHSVIGFHLALLAGGAFLVVVSAVAAYSRRRL